MGQAVERWSDGLSVALILTGRAAHIQESFPTIRDFVIEPSNCDVFMFTEKKDMESVLKYNKEYKIDAKALCFSDDYLEIPETEIGKFMVERGKSTGSPKHFDRSYHERYFLQIKGIAQGFNFVFDNYREYDWYIRCRFDMMFDNELDDLSKRDNENLYVPNYGAQPHSIWCYDRFGFGGYNVMRKYADRWDFVRTDTPLPEDFDIGCPERELAYAMRDVEIKNSTCRPRRCRQST